MNRLPSTILALAATLPCLAPTAIAGNGDRPLVRHTSEHYDLRLQGGEEEARRLGSMLELAWPRFREYFQVEPGLKDGERLVIQLYDDARQCEVGAMNDRADMPPIKHPSWFSPRNRTVYLYRHASDWCTRYLLLYGACLQFHGLAKAKNIDLDTWYAHGIAESLAVHAFDGKRLELGASPSIAWIDHPRRALAELGGRTLGLDPFTEQRLEDPSVRWSVVRFATASSEGRYRERFDKLALGRTGSKVSGFDFMRSLGNEKRIAEEFSIWLLGNQMPLEVLTPDWEMLPDGRIRGSPAADRISLCAAKAPFDTLEVVVTAPGKEDRAIPSVVLSLQNEDDYVRARFVPPLVFVEHVRSGRQYGIETWSLDGVRPVFRVRVRTQAERAEVEIDGKTYPVVEVPPGRVGLAATGGPVDFDGVKWR
jgi:hypothetical protein